MLVNENQQKLLRMLPSVEYVLEISYSFFSLEDIPRNILVNSIREAIEFFRKTILKNEDEIKEDNITDANILEKVKNIIKDKMSFNLKPLINATGVVIHTNLGRSLLAKEVIDNLTNIATCYSNLEYDLTIGERGSRYTCVEDILCQITGSESAMVVNNNAGAVLLCLETIAKNKKVIVSRGELVEIGGSFRIPDVMARSGCILTEVGATNRTHLKDYEKAIDDNVGLLLKVHTSNYAILGFTSSVSLSDLVLLGKKYQIPIMEDLGSGTFIDFTNYGLIKEPTVQESISSGVDLITFSGDKLLGGPQSGVILGKKKILDEIKKNPLTRALRIDKLTLSALESTLRLYFDPQKAVLKIPTLRMLTMPLIDIKNRALHLTKILEDLQDERLIIKIFDLFSKAGGGSMPLLSIPTKCVGISIKGTSSNKIELFMRKHAPPIIGRIEEDIFLMDLRTVQDNEIDIIKDAFKNILNRG